MAAEGEPEKPEDAAAEAKGLADQFVQTLGLVDLIIGGLALYWSRLWFGADVTRFLETTGYPWLDIALLACAAAFVGKIVSLVAELAAGLIDDQQKHAKGGRLTQSLNGFKDALADESNMGDADKLDLATTYLINANPKLRPDLERIYNASTLAYSMTIIASLFAAYFFSKRSELQDAGPPVMVIVVLAVLVIGFVIYGLLNQFEYVDMVVNNLNFAAAKLKLDKARDAAEAVPPTPINVNLSAADKISVEVIAKPITVELQQY